MHEVGVAKEILKVAIQNAGGKKINLISVELAEDGHTTAESLTDAFSLIARGTLADGARLLIKKTEAVESRVSHIEVEK